MTKAFFLTFSVLLFCCAVYGQINTREEPISFRSSVPILAKSEKTTKSFAPLDMKKIELEDMEDAKNGIPPRFGYPHDANYNLDNSGEWVKLPNGDKIWRLVISCQEAVSINLLYDKFWLPNGAKFFVYGKDRKHTIGAITSANNKGDKNDIQGFATGLVFGDQITLEYYLPKDVKETGVISVAYVVHGYRYVYKMDKTYGQSGNCNINVNCNQGHGWQNEKNAVAMILVDGARWCSGSLVNTTANDGRPLFLTANHCLTNNADAISAPILNYWSFYWHYESPGCLSAFDPPHISTSGATVVANNSTSDFALLRLTENPRYANGVTPYYLGWDRSGSSGTGGVGIHHPKGDIKKISIYKIAPTSMTYSGNTVSNGHWRIVWSDGTTEGGSSGSPLINSTRRVISNKIADPPDGERYDRALYLSRAFELRDTYLKMYYGDKNDYLLFRPWGRSAVSNADSAVSQTESGTEVKVTGRDIVLAGGEFVAGPNPVSKSAGFVNFYRDGKQVRRASLKVYNASGRSVGKISIKDGGKPADGQVLSRRRVGSWDLKDAKGRPVSEGTYLVKGTIKTGERTAEKIALLINIR